MNAGYSVGIAEVIVKQSSNTQLRVQQFPADELVTLNWCETWMWPEPLSFFEGLLCDVLLTYPRSSTTQCIAVFKAKNLSSTLKKNIQSSYQQQQRHIAEDGFDPSSSGLWAQHACTAPLCLCQASYCTLNGSLTQILCHWRYCPLS